jgi:hypothetical protein
MEPTTMAAAPPSPLTSGWAGCAQTAAARRGPRRGPPPDRPASTPRLTRAALAFRVAHGAVAAGFLLAIAYVWWCAVSGQRGPWLRVAVAALTTVGTLGAAMGGDCPLGGLQGRMGDPIPLFELVLSPRAARRAVPVLGGIAAVGIALVVVRGRSAAS